MTAETPQTPSAPDPGAPGADGGPPLPRARRLWLPLPRGRLGKVLVALAAALISVMLLLGVLAWISTDHFRAFGGRPAGPRLDRMRVSPHFEDGAFVNLEPTTMMAAKDYGKALRHWFFGKEMRTPICPVPIVTGPPGRFDAPPASGLRVTWLGHSTTLIELDGARFLTDPVWSERASPSTWFGPRRFHPPPVAIEDLPPLDAVLISHEHYDHLDMRTIQALAARPTAAANGGGATSFHVPLGIGAHLEAWGVPASRIVEHDWWQDAAIAGGVRVVSTPARHFTGRGVPWHTGSLWTSWSIIGPRHRLFFSGDTGLTESLREIGQRLGPFDVALLEIGQYHPTWGQIHLGPAGALDAFTRLGARTLIPIHWATFLLAYHAWSEPAETVVVEAQRRALTILTPRPGEPVEPAATPPSPTTAWWRSQPPLASGCPAPASPTTATSSGGPSPSAATAHPARD